MLLAAVVLAAGCLAAGCAQGGNIGSGASSRSVSISPPTFSPTTRAPVQTTAPATGQPAVTSSATTASGSGSSLLWLWIVLGAAIVIGGVALLARRSGRRSATAAGWRSRVADAYAKGSALYDTMSLAEAPGALTAEGASARWVDIQRRADDLTQTLYALRESAPNDVERARVADVLASLQAVRSAMDAEHGPGGTAIPPGRVRDLLLSFDASLRALRSPDNTGP
jgi:hypothetical protein